MTSLAIDQKPADGGNRTFVSSIPETRFISDERVQSTVLAELFRRGFARFGTN